MFAFGPWQLIILGIILAVPVTIIILLINKK